jgi:hypothetical protein
MPLFITLLLLMQSVQAMETEHKKIFGPVLQSMQKRKFRLKHIETKNTCNINLGRVINAPKLMTASIQSQKTPVREFQIIPEVNYFGDARDDTIFEYFKLIMESNKNRARALESRNTGVKERCNCIYYGRYLIVIIVSCGLVFYRYIV